jgi:hypothetical protein
MEKRYNWRSCGFDVGFNILIYINAVHKTTDNDAKVVLFANDTSITVTDCNQEGGFDERIKLNGSARNGWKVKTVQ